MSASIVDTLLLAKQVLICQTAPAASLPPACWSSPYAGDDPKTNGGSARPRGQDHRLSCR